MNVLAFLVLAVLVIFSIAFWFDARAKLYAQQYKSAMEEKSSSLQVIVDGVLGRITELEKEIITNPEEMPEGQKRDERMPMSSDSVRLAISPNGYTIENPDTQTNERVVHFKVNGAVLRIDTSHLPFMAIELGYSLDPSQEDVELMRQAAADVTTGIFIGKVIIYGDAKALAFNAELACDSYAQFRDDLKRYLDIIFDTQKRFTDTYNQLKEEKRKREEKMMEQLQDSSPEKPLVNRKIVS